MGSTFGSLQIGLRALQANQLALEVTGQNIANVDTEGYSRQVPILTTTQPYDNPTGTGQVGTGVDISAIVSMRDKFVDVQIRSATSKLGDMEAQQSVYQYMETVFNESSDASISNYIDEFWSTLHELSTNASDASVRSSVFENANALTSVINDTYSQLLKLQQDCDDNIATLVDKVNSLTTQIGDLNKVIREVTASGQNANDLMDQREQLTQDLAELVNISVQTTSTNEYFISVSGAALVSGKDAYALTTVNNAEGFIDIAWEKTGTAANIQSGQIGGYLKMRDGVVKDYLDDLDQFATTLISEFNTVHENGYGLDGSHDVSFFSGTSAGNIAVAITNVNQIAAATVANASGDGANAVALANVLNTDLLIDGLTFDQYYNTIINQLASIHGV